MLNLNAKSKQFHVTDTACHVFVTADLVHVKGPVCW